MTRLTLDRVESCQQVLADLVRVTPLLLSEALSKRFSARIYIKYENRQHTASFKVRGAGARMAKLPAAVRAKGVVAMSAGNHAQGVAYHARLMGIPARIFMPEGTPHVKIQQTEAQGGAVQLAGATLAAASDAARRHADATGATFIHPYDDPVIAAGQGTVALEMLSQAPELDMMVVPVGGGGLLCGMAAAAKGLKPDIKIVGVQAKGYAAAWTAYHGNAPGTPPAVTDATLAEGIAVEKPGLEMLTAHRDLIDDMWLVEETWIESAISLFLEQEKIVAEGAGAAGLAALLSEPDRVAGRTVGLVLSGGNIDPRILASVIMRSMVRDGRVTRFRIEIPDKPGALAEIAGLIGRLQGNIIEVAHQRLFPNISAKKTDLEVLLETRDAVHRDEIGAALHEAGYDVRVFSEVNSR